MKHLTNKNDLVYVKNSNNGIDSSMRDLIDGSGAILPFRVSSKGIQIKSSGTDALALIDISDAAATPVIRFKQNSDRVFVDGYSDVFLGTGNGNIDSLAGGNIGIGGNNLQTVNASSGFIASPWWSSFSGDRNIAIGYSNGRSIVSGSGNILLGQKVFEQGIYHSYNIFIGFQTAMGMKVPFDSDFGNENIGIGSYIMMNVTAGQAALNTLIGEATVRYTTTMGRENAFVGPGCGIRATDIGNYNAAFGVWSLGHATAGITQMAAFGPHSGIFAGGDRNTIIGPYSGWTLRGTSNVSIGHQSAYVSNNNYTTWTASGSSGAGTPFTGLRSTFIGYRSGYTIATAATNDVVVIGQIQPVLVAGNSYLAAVNDVLLVSKSTGVQQTAKLDVNGIFSSPKLQANNELYIGDAATDGSWKFVVSGADLVIQKRVAGAYVTKSTIVGA